MSKKDYYEVLGVGKDASADEIKRAYRRLAVEHHPDKTGGEDTKFKEVNEAYEVLKDPKKKQQYDQFGHSGPFGAGAGGGGHNPFGGGGQFEFDMGGLDLDDIFGSFFGGGRRGRKQPTRGRDLETVVELEFKEAVFGVEKTIVLNLEDLCSHCHGTMAEPGSSVKTCDTCHGQGQIVHTQSTILGNIQQVTTCHICHGRGKIPEKPCKICGGKGTQRQEKRLKVKIPAGIDNGSTIRMREQGEALAGGTHGDLYVHIRVRPSREFERHGQDIFSETTINMVEAALGTEIDVNTVDGPIKMKIPSGTQSGQIFKLSERGVPFANGKRRGSHLAKVTVAIPKKLTAKQKALLKEFGEASDKSFWSR